MLLAFLCVSRLAYSQYVPYQSCGACLSGFSSYPRYFYGCTPLYGYAPCIPRRYSYPVYSSPRSCCFSCLSGDSPDVDLEALVGEIVEYQDQTAVLKKMLQDQTFTTLTDKQIDKALKQYSSDVKELNQLRFKMEKETGKQGDQAKSQSELQKKIDDIWGRIVMTELWISNTGTKSSPLPITQYVFAQQFPTGSAFSDEMKTKGDELAKQVKNKKDGWLCVCWDEQNSKLNILQLPDNNLAPASQYQPMIIVPVSEEYASGDIKTFIEKYLQNDCNWQVVEQRLRSYIPQEVQDSVLSQS
ncbi:hypothetical protein BLNAU_536 [Blattamonas nauphoetae]|uniref:Uncharacterized protein n=1 Tax=Blattamonas nauphoetae TaxID=2049346 RepID=A0ABQ9YLI3_9EUKA|nr:hypothetical protein BLNAU_536 [Blattamonas nauphoetae]